MSMSMKFIAVKEAFSTRVGGTWGLRFQLPDGAKRGDALFFGVILPTGVTAPVGLLVGLNYGVCFAPHGNLLGYGAQLTFGILEDAGYDVTISGYAVPCYGVIAAYRGIGGSVGGEIGSGLIAIPGNASATIPLATATDGAGLLGYSSAVFVAVSTLDPVEGYSSARVRHNRLLPVIVQKGVVMPISNTPTLSLALGDADINDPGALDAALGFSSTGGGTVIYQRIALVRGADSYNMLRLSLRRNDARTLKLRPFRIDQASPAGEFTHQQVPIAGISEIVFVGMSGDGLRIEKKLSTGGIATQTVGGVVYWLVNFVAADTSTFPNRLVALNWQIRCTLTTGQLRTVAMGVLSVEPDIVV